VHTRAHTRPILTIKWRSIFIAWANDLGVKLYDMSAQQRISYIDRPKQAPRADEQVDTHAPNHLSHIIINGVCGVRDLRPR
jgi:hypothetical protein